MTISLGVGVMLGGAGGFNRLSLPTEGLLSYTVGGVDTIGLSGITTIKNSLDDTDLFNVYGYAAELAGTEVFTCASITGKTVSDKIGTAVIAIGTGQVTVTTPGTLSWFTLSGGEKYVLQSDPTFKQEVFYDQNSIGDPLVLTLGTGVLPLCTAIVLGSLLLSNGYKTVNDVDGNELSPSPNFLTTTGVNLGTGATQDTILGTMTLQQVGTERVNFYVSASDKAYAKGFYRFTVVVDELSAGSEWFISRATAYFDTTEGNNKIDSAGTFVSDIVPYESRSDLGLSQSINNPAGSSIKISKFSVQYITQEKIPGNPATGSVSTGDDLTTEPFDISQSPILLEAIDPGGWYETDTRHGEGQYFNSNETSKQVSPSDIYNNFENTEFFGNNSFAAYSTEQDEATTSRILRFLKETPVYYERLSNPSDPTSVTLGMLTDSHYSAGLESETETAITTFRSNDINGVIHCGDVHVGSGDWVSFHASALAEATTILSSLELMRVGVKTYEDLYQGIDADQVAMVAGNRDLSEYVTFDDYFSESKYSRRTKSILVGNYRILSLLDTEQPSYTADSASLTFLTDALAAANSASEHVIIIMHVPPGAEFLQTASFTTIISDADTAGTVIRCIVTGHEHAWQQDLDFGGLGIPRVTLNAVGDSDIAHYVMDITSIELVIREFTTSGEVTKLTFP